MLNKLLAAVAVMLLLGAGAISAQDDIDPQLETQMVGLEAITQTLRGLEALEPVERVFPSRAETIDYLRDLYERELTIDEAERWRDFYVALGLLPPDIDLRQVFLDLLGSQVAGFYDTDTKTMNVLPTVGDDPGTSLSLSEQIIYVHEFTHALQDQYFALDSLLETANAEINPDQSLAVTSLVEGDASAVMTLYTQEVSRRNPLAALGMLAEGLQAGNLFLPPGIPNILVRELMFPYEQGMNFVVALYEHGGWEAINAAYDNPPTTSEQIFHPEKYISGEGALHVEMVDFSAALGEGWTEVLNTTVGEFYLREMLRTELADSRARRAAAGWGGDNLRLYRGGADLAWGLLIVWDSADEAAEFVDLHAAYADDRFGTEAIDGCWTDADSALCVSGAGDETLIVSAPTLETAQAIAAAVADSP